MWTEGGPRRSAEKRTSAAKAATSSESDGTAKAVPLRRNRASDQVEYFFMRLGFDEAVAALPLLLEAGPDGFDFGAGDGGVGLLYEVGGFLAGQFEEVAVAG